jgi:Xaa-Pro aminopeptidase
MGAPAKVAAMADADVLIFGDTIRSPELRHEVPVNVMDPFLYVERDGRRIAVVGSLDAGSIAAAAADLEILAPEELGSDELMESGMHFTEVPVELAARACDRLGVTRATVPPDFPVDVADRLRAADIALELDRKPFTARRRVKTSGELAGIRRAQGAAEAGMAAAAEILREADAGGNELVHRGETVTSERIKRAIQLVLQEHECASDAMIVASGAQGAEGHNFGSGPIAPGAPVVVDLWPQDRASGCFADMTRTFVPGGPPSEELTDWHALSREAYKRALEAIRPGAAVREVWGMACDVFEAAGHPTQRTKKPGEVLAEGFFFSLGHGVGLQVHEAPLVGRSPEALVAGDVLAIEPGTCRLGFGEVRIEDLVLVSDEGPQVLTDFPYDLEP